MTRSAIKAEPNPVSRPRNSIRPPAELPSACIAASLMVRTGRSKAATTLKPTHHGAYGTYGIHAPMLQEASPVSPVRHFGVLAHAPPVP
jgi:hypothetical protein